MNGGRIRTGRDIHSARSPYWMRPSLYQWAFFAMTELEPAVIAWSRTRQEEADETEARERFWSVATVVDQTLEGSDWLLGEEFSVADVIVAKIIELAFARELTGDFGRLRAYSDDAQARPANVRAEAVGRLEIQA
jgi:glutathione S-transferase